MLGHINSFSQNQFNYKPLKYLLHRNSINNLFLYFDSLTFNRSLSIVKGMERNTIKVYFNGYSMEKVVSIHEDSLKLFSKELDIDNNKLIKVIHLIYKSKTHSIKNVDNRIEICNGFGLRNILSDNGKGLIYFPKEYKKKLTENKRTKIKKHIVYSSAISSY